MWESQIKKTKKQKNFCFSMFLSFNQRTENDIAGYDKYSQ